MNSPNIYFIYLYTVIIYYYIDVFLGHNAQKSIQKSEIKNSWNKLLQVFLLTSQIIAFTAHFGMHQFSLSNILCLEIYLMTEITGQSRRNKRHGRKN